MEHVDNESSTSAMKSDMVETARSRSDASIQDCALQDVGVLQRMHNFDPNLPDQEIRHLNEAIKTGNIEKTIEVDASFTNESPYEAVRAAVREIDGEEIANTIRAWMLGFVFVTLASGINMFLSMRSPAITIPTVVILLLVYPCGQFMAKVLPTKKFRTFGVTWSSIQ